MNILNDVVSGAARQFGREFGRAGANSILKGANSYIVRGISDYSGRIKPSDSAIVKAIKEVQKIKFVSTNKANASRLIDITDVIISNIEFDGNNTLNELNDITELIDQYNDKFNHGSSLIDDDFEDKSIEFLEERRNEFVRLIDKFNGDIKNHITESLKRTKENKKIKKTAILLALPLLGFQWAYLKAPGYTILSIILCLTVIVPIINLIALIQMLLMSEEKFDKEHNPEYVYYKQFKIKA